MNALRWVHNRMRQAAAFKLAAQRRKRHSERKVCVTCCIDQEDQAKVWLANQEEKDMEDRNCC